MQLNVQLAPEIEFALRRRAKALGQEVEMFVAAVVARELSDDAKTMESSSGAIDTTDSDHLRRHPSLRMSLEEFDRRTEEWIKLHPRLDHPIDDSRESIYEGCGE